MEGMPDYKEEQRRIECYKKKFFELKRKIEKLENEKNSLQLNSRDREINLKIKDLEEEKSKISFELWKRLKPV